MGRNFFNSQRGSWFTPQSDANKRERAKDMFTELDGFPTNTLDGGLKSPKARFVLSEDA